MNVGVSTIIPSNTTEAEELERVIQRIFAIDHGRKYSFCLLGDEAA
jgi:hypothetical protein